MTLAVGIDFGTTNSVVAVAQPDGQVRSFAWPSVAGPTDMFRSALLFWSEGRQPKNVLRHVAGPEALERATSGATDHRFVQSAKTYLASRSFSETRLYGRTLRVEDLVGLFLNHLLEGHRADLADCVVVAGRPVVFAGANPDAALAETRLRAAYAQAGLPTIDFAFEPVGAAYWYARDLTRDATVLVADFGGGTSDFSVMRFAHVRGRLTATPLAHDGVGIAGDAFDARLVEHLVAPKLGKGARYRSFDKWLPIPAAHHAALSHWHSLSMMKSTAVLEELRRLARSSDRPDALEDLRHLIEYDLGFALYRAVNTLKAELSDRKQAHFLFKGGDLTIEGDVTRADFERWIAADLARIANATDGAIAKAGLGAADIDAVFLTGGTSFVPAVRKLFVDRFGSARVQSGHAFQSVASGLALRAADMMRVSSPGRLASVHSGD